MIQARIVNPITWILLGTLWLLSLLLLGAPVFADSVSARAQELGMPAAQNLFSVSYDDAENAVTHALTEKGIGDKVSALVNGRNFKPMFTYSKPITLEVRGLNYNERNGRWDASLAFLSEGEVVSAMPVSGHFDLMMEVAVLKRERRSGDIIQESDIEIRDFSARQVRSDMVTDLSAVIGKTPLRTISAFRPIRMSEVSSPAVIKKDALVNMQYRVPGMDIHTTGQAITAGAKDEVINVRNSASKKIVRAVVIDSNTVSILAAGQETSQLTGAANAPY